MEMLSRQIELRAYAWRLDNEVLDTGKTIWEAVMCRMRLIEAVGVNNSA